MSVDDTRLSLAEATVRFMVQELGAERAAVVLPGPPKTKPLPTAQYGLKSSNIWGDSTIHRAAIEELAKGSSSIMVIDARTHPQYRSSESYRNVMGVTFADNGFLYCDHSQAGQLDDETLGRLKRHASTLEKRLTAEAKKANQKSSETVSQIKSSRPVLGAVGFVLSVLLVTGLWWLKGDPEPIKPSAVPKSEYTVQLSGHFRNFRGNRRPPEKSKFTVDIVGGDKVVLTPQELNFDSNGGYSAKVKTKMAKPPAQLAMKVEIPRFKTELLRAKVDENVADLSEVTLAPIRRRNSRGEAPSNNDASQSERQAIRKLSRDLPTTRKQRKKSKPSDP